MSTGTATTMSEEEITRALKEMARGFGHTRRSPILKTPTDYGLDYEDVTFPSQDGVPLEVWWIPRGGSEKLIIANHPLGFNRYGFPPHQEPWKSTFADTGNDFEVDYVPDYRILHDAGYNVLTYDERNFGHSGAANGGLVSSGRFESRDVVGSLIYAATRPHLKDMTVGLFSRCNGANATIFAMDRQPEYFEGVRCLLAPMPLSAGVPMERSLERLGIPERIDDLEREVKLVVSFGFDEMSPVEWAKSVRVPTFLYQVRDDVMTRPSDVQSMFDNIPTADKKLQWIEGTSVRWDGYLEFQRRPEPMLEWFEKHMS